MIGWAFDAVIGTTLLMLLVLAVRRPVAHFFGASWAYALWLLPALRLLMPQFPALSTPVSVPSITVVLPAMEAAAAPLPATGGGTDWILVLLALWAGGAVAFVIWHQSSYSAFLLSIGSSPRPGDPPEYGGIQVIESEAVDGPVAVGMFERRIVVPPLFNWHYSEAEQRLALEHELVHHRRGDLWWNMAALAVLALNWFNPVAWIAYRAFRDDQELACDAAVARRAPDRCHDYASALVKAASHPGQVATCPLNRADLLKRRLKMMKNHRATKARTAGGAAALAILAAGGLALSSPGFAQRDEVGEVVVAAVEKDGPMITAAEQATIREKCGEGAPAQGGIALRGRDGVLLCDNGNAVDDPDVRAIVATVTERARTRVASAMAQPEVVAAIEGRAAERAQAAARSIDTAKVREAVARARAEVRVDMAEVRKAMASARAQAHASIAAIDVDSIRADAARAAQASARAHVAHRAFTAEHRAEVEAALAEARADMEYARIDHEEIARSVRESQRAAREALREADLDRREALREAAREVEEAHRERDRALREAEIERQHALRDADRERRRALEEAGKWARETE